MEQEKMSPDMLSGRCISRRDFLAAAAKIGVGMAAASMMWDARADTSSPKKGGHMIAALQGGSTNDSMDQQTWIGSVMIAVGRATRDSLVEHGPDNKLMPALAESWEPNANAAEWRFKLRRGVEFSNGKSLKTEDVIASINLHRGAQSKSAAKGVFEAIQSVTADGDAVVIKLSGPNADFPFLLTDYHMNVVPAPGGKPDLSGGTGTGLYKVVQFEPGVKVTVERHKNAWQADRYGFVDSAEVLSVADPTARQNALIAGAVHVINRPDLRTAKLLERRAGIKLVDVPSNFFFASPMLTNVKPFDSADFRRALKYGINRDQFVKKILNGFGAIGNDQPIGPGYRYHASDIPQTVYDLDKARYYLKKSGLTGARIDYYASDEAYNGAVDYGLIMKENLAPLGIDLNVVRAPNDGYWSNIWNVKPFVASYWGSRPVEDMILSINWVSRGPWNDTRWGSPKVDELVVSARGELDTRKRAEMYREIQLLLNQDGATIVPAFGHDVAAISSKVGTTGQYGGGWELDGGHFLKRWWLNA
ncbi:ABC transporter substrate-binding protein [Paraburkholderia antibiotica]|uniref:ABC transporter substrate-binding protein n=1 Tax=Paraburkholderia antibiotica TaxID=2728839 RepID=A0A7X9X6D3_9BURK|nr:ABC transporter substrate-binding protein [Paraburkholderia antibiotica]NML32311.1 ABC transporter substrate-binding protein [Paraburkholderia antibiotica]